MYIKVCVLKYRYKITKMNRITSGYDVIGTYNPDYSVGILSTNKVKSNYFAQN